MTNKAHGFTIVELLIVIVVIAILAAISIVAYSGIQDRAVRATLQSDLRTAKTQLSLLYTDDNVYPLTIGSVKKSPDTRFQYHSDGSAFCLTASSTRASAGVWRVSSSGDITEGACPGHSASPGAAGFATRVGYTDITFSYGASSSIAAPIGDINTGSWMVVVLAYTNPADPTPPAGWTTLVSRKDTGTLRTSIYAKIKQPGDASSQLFAGSARDTTNAVLLWGADSAPVANWALGSFGDRTVNATSTTAVTPTLTTTSANSLVLSIATERTNSDEANYAALAGATPWIWIAQPTGNVAKNQTITIGYNEQTGAGVSQPMTVTYPNSQVNNATAVQLAIPPAV